MLYQRLKEGKKKKLKAAEVQVVNKKEDMRERGEEKETQEKYVFHYVASPLQCSVPSEYLAATAKIVTNK